MKLLLIKENLLRRAQNLEKAMQGQRKKSKNPQELLQNRQALEREVNKYKTYGITSQVFEVTLKIRTINTKLIINERDRVIWYADCDEEDIPELVHRDLKKKKYKIIKVEKIILGTLINK